MKNKSSHHKESNTFKFQPFAERIANIDIDVFHKIGHEYENDTDSENESYFHQAMENWSILNLTESFDQFKKEIQPKDLITLPQLLLEKERVISILLKHLRMKNPLCLQPLLEIVVAIAKDIRKDFYPYYKEFLDVLIDLLNTKNTDQLEWTFTCLAYIFKFLWRPLLKDITVVFNSLLPLLSSTKPEYINNFAASSFAFVARKVKDHHSFLTLVLKTVKSQKDGIEGCGKLFFEVINGVNGQFHSCAETFLPFLLESLSNPNYHQKTLYDILEQVISNIASNIQPQKSELLWNSYINILQNLQNNWKNSKDTKTATEIELILKLLGQSIEYRNGKLLHNHIPILQQIISLFDNDDLPESVLITTTQIGILLLLSKNIRLTQEQASEITKKILSLPQQSVLLYFVDHISDFTSFEYLILPTFLKHCLKQTLNKDCFSILTKLIIKKSPLCGCGINLSKWSKYTIDFNNNESNVKVQTKLFDYISNFNFDDADFTYYLMSIICLPHLSNVDNSKFEKCLIDNVLNFLKIIENEVDGGNIGDKSKLKKAIFLLNVTIESLIHLKCDDVLLKYFNELCDLLLPLAKNENYLNALKILDLLIAAFEDKDEIIKMDNLKKIDGFLASNFSSPYHEVRLITSHLYTYFENLPEFDLKHSDDPEVPKEKFSVFSICYRVESIDSQVQTYRNQTQQLEKFNFDKPQMIMCNKTEFRTIPLRYLCGVLYINFKLLWEPVLALIQTHATGLDINVFWGIYGEELKKVVGNVRDRPEPEIDLLITSGDYLGDYYQESQRLVAKPDFFNYRLLLWKGLAQFPDIAESKTRDVSELLLDFIEKEYTKSNSDVALTWNIKQNSSTDLPDDSVVETNQDEEEEEKEEEEAETKVKPKKTGHRANTLALLNFLTVFSKIKSPKSMYREPDLNKLYFDLLQHKNQDIQKVALDCIMTYKHKYLTPYKDNLYNLVDPKTFKNEIVSFRIDKDSPNVIENHRENLIPVVMRIVFSKMSAKAGLRTGGKSSGQNRRNLVFRFLAGCAENEMLTFLKMSFRYYSNYLQDDPELMIKKLSDEVDLEKFVPPKRLQSTLNLLQVIIEQFGNLMGGDLLNFILQILLAIGAVIRGAFQQIPNIHAGYLTVLRQLRNSCTKLIARFFGQFDKFLWTNKQINAIFDIFVWPYLDKLIVEGIHSPTALLKLFLQWGTNPRYFPLLVKHDGDENNYILPHIIKLLLNQKSNISVVNVIEEILEKLLSLQADDEDLQLIIPVDNLLPIQKHILDRIKIDDKLNYGSCILLPHVPSILEKIKRKLESKSKNLNTRELFILSRISELVWEADISDSTLKLLLPIILKKCSSNIGEEVIVQFLTTVHNLIQNVEKPQIHLKMISALFSEISYPSGRKLLIKSLQIICSQLETLKTGENLVIGLNAWDARWVDQPDFQRRHDTFKDVDKAIDDGTIDIDLGVLIIHNCYFLLKSEKDLSLRENSLHCLKKITPYLIGKYKNTKELDYLFNDIIFKLIRNGMRNQNNDFRNDCIGLLGHLARECPDAHIILTDLNKYTNKVDLEVDFFENLTHLQIHRHGRALLKFCQITKDLTKAPNVRTLTQFILPLASFYLCSEKYISKNSVIDGAIECIGTVCRILPWHQYEGLLKYYLTELRRKVDYQKQLVRLTVAILDSFHFDLSKGELFKQAQEALQNEDVEQKMIEDSEKPSEELIQPAVDDKIEEEVKENEIDVGEALDDIGEDVEEDEEVEEKPTEDIKICEKTTVLCKSTATRVTRTIQMVLLPQLHKSLAEMTHHDTLHKVNRKKTGFEREEEDLLRVPISLALVKLLQRLPKELLDSNLPGIFMKLCSFLKSHMESVRRVTRETLQKIMQTLGPDYLGVLLGVMSPLLNRGFQVHVLVFTTHAILNCLREFYKPGDIDKILLTVLNLCQADLFGSLSEEKEVVKIAVKTAEAKSTKSFDTFQILAQYITDKCLLDLIMPIKNVLQTSHSYKTVHKAEESLRHVALGLVDNNFISVESMLKFAYGTANESIPELITANKKPEMTEKEKEKLKRAKPDCFIIPKAPVGRSGFRVNNVKSSTAVNAHLLVEFGLRLCFVLLKRDKLKENDYRPFLDPFVRIFKNCLKSKYVKLNTITLQCLTWVMKFDLPSMKNQISGITKDIFQILHKFAAAGLSKGDNFDLVVAAFKAMAVLVRDVKYHTINTDQLKILLLYVEEDMHDHDRQATAFSLLKAIIARKLIIPEIHDVMSKVAELSITSELDHVRAQARAVFYQYMMEYPLENRLDKHIGFYVSQMSYEMRYGRESAIEMIHSLINSFPIKVLKDQSGMLLVTLGTRLVNDDTPECRKMVANCITSMLERLSKTGRNPLFELILAWLKDDNLSHRRLAAQLCGIFVNVEQESFQNRIPKLLAVVMRQFGLDENNDEKDTKIAKVTDDEDQERIKDHYLFQTLQMLLKVCAQCPVFLKNEKIKPLAEYIQTLLAYPHDWVRLAAAQFLGFVLSNTDIKKLTNLVTDNKSDESGGYLHNEPLKSVKKLTLDLCDQLQPGSIKSDLAEQVIKNLVFIGRVLQNIPIDKNSENKINLLWLTKRMRKIINTEIVEASNSIILRTEVFKWIAAMGTVLEVENILKVLNHLLAPLVREMITTEESNAPLRQLSKEVSNILKKRVGMDVYTKTLSSLQQNLSVKRAERKRSRTQLAVTDPEMFAKKKIKRHEKKKEAKKRKIAELRGKKSFKRKKVVDLEPRDEVM